MAFQTSFCLLFFGFMETYSFVISRHPCSALQPGSKCWLQKSPIPANHEYHRVLPTKIVSRRFLLIPRMSFSVLGPIGPFCPFRSSYCSTGVVEKEMADLTSLAHMLNLKFQRMMLEFQVLICCVFEFPTNFCLTF